MKIKLLSLSIAFTLITATAFSQDTNQAVDSIALKNWYHQSYEKTGIYGVGTNDAINFLKSKGLKPSPIIVGVIDSGVQIDHPDLKNNIWVNSKEIANNGKDDDGNGYTDDIHGWDFIGGKDGKDVDHDTMESTRIVSLYEKLFGKDYFEVDDIYEKNRKKFPNEFREYLRAVSVYEKELKEAKMSLSQIDEQKEMIRQMTDILQKALGDKPMTIENINAAEFTIPQYKTAFLQMLENNSDLEGKNATQIKMLADSEMGEAVQYYSGKVDYMLNKNYDPRSIVGDNYADIKEKYYGNNEVEGPDALHGTHVSGIIAAERNNKIGMDGIAGDVAKILVVRAVPDGDERDKDIANAIHYAVDNGAKIINMSFGKPFSPNKERVWEAMKYAEKKGVLMVHAAGNDNKNVDTEYNYPTNFKDNENKSFVNNWITVGASTRYNNSLKASFSNYGKEKVDIFAPGLEIYSTITKGKYKFLQGTSMASPVVAGCAALLWAYFPQLSAEQVKEILFITANKSTTAVEAGGESDNSPAITTTFDQLSSTGGVVDVYRAVKYAYDNFNPNKKSKK
ncbi:S8 family peptidase [uncultured Apibacter sp.]|uniref:S8 family peptidase n=1 Tax=uncultured Apibacter sp. TaxID=1778616 RepID=UPI0025D59DC2|nr:S8 family peptidase [uncultured Apibacter sp.]